MVYVGLGSNLGDRPSRLRKGIAGIDRLPRTRVVRRSSFYRSLPMGVIDQPLFLNAVVQIRTRLTPLDLLEELQKIERRSGRIRKLRWGPRTLDLDILVYGDIIMDREDLRIPHPGIPIRLFVLYPLLQIAPRLPIPEMGTPVSMVKECPGPAPKRWRRSLDVGEIPKRSNVGAAFSRDCR